MGEPKKERPIAAGLIAVLVALVLTIVFLRSFHYFLIEKPAQETERDHWSQEAKTSPENLMLICPPSQDGKPIPADQCKRTGHYEYDREQQILDHNAQLSMRTAAWFTAGLTGVGLILVSLTLVEARRAAGLAVEVLDEAKLATTAANDSLIATEKASFNDMRPWIDVIEASSRKIPTDFNEDYLEITFRVKNVGKSPARELTLEMVTIHNQNASLTGQLRMGIGGQPFKGSIISNADFEVTQTWLGNAGFRVPDNYCLTVSIRYSSIFDTEPSLRTYLYIVNGRYSGNVNGNQVNSSEGEESFHVTHQ